MKDNYMYPIMDGDDDGYRPAGPMMPGMTNPMMGCPMMNPMMPGMMNPMMMNPMAGCPMMQGMMMNPMMSGMMNPMMGCPMMNPMAGFQAYNPIFTYPMEEKK